METNIDKKQWLYNFELSNEDGKSFEFLIKKPKRKIREDGDLYYAKKLAEYVKAGLLPMAAWETILNNFGGTISEDERANYIKWKVELKEKLFAATKLELKEILTDEEKAEKDKIELELADLRSNIQSFEMNQFYIFENTAEAKARNKAILWWSLQLAHEKVGDKTEKFFKGDGLEAQLDYYDDLDPENATDAFRLKVATKFNYFVTLWYLNRVVKFEDFEAVDQDKKIVAPEEEIIIPTENLAVNHPYHPN